MACSASSSQYPSSGSEETQPARHYFSAADNDHRYLRKRCGMLLAAFNEQALSVSLEERTKGWNDLVNPKPTDGELLQAPLVKSPLWMDYGLNVRIAPSAFINRNCYIGDSPYASVVIGEGVLIGSNVQILSVTHECDWRQRNGMFGPSWAAPVVIEDDVYIGSSVTILPGVTIGDGSAIGAGSVVTKSIPAFHVAMGNPATPVRKIALDSPDAPGLLYEQKGDRMIVVRADDQRNDEREQDACCGPQNRQEMVGDPTPAMVTPSSTTTHARYNGRSGQAERELMKVLRAMEPEMPGPSGVIGIDVLLLVVAVMGAWLILHATLY